MIVRKLTDQLFIHLSKMYMHFYKEKKDYWYIFPSLMISLLFGLNLQTLSFFVMPVPRYHYVYVGIGLALFFLILYRNIKYEYIRDYNMTNKTRVIITLLIVVDLIINFVLTSMLRDGKLQRIFFL